jgi:hypothetical protein
MNRPNSFSPLLFRLYASDLSEAVSKMSQERMHTRIIGSDKFVTMDGKTVMVSQMATDDEIAAALHRGNAASGSQNQATNNYSTYAGQLAAATPLPPAPTITPVAKPAAQGSFAASLKAIVDEAKAGIEQAKADGLAQVRDAVGDLSKAKEATLRVTGNMASTVKSQAADIMAELGQISNDL